MINVITETCRGHKIWYLRLYYYHCVDASAGALLVTKNVIRTVAKNVIRPVAKNVIHPVVKNVIRPVIKNVIRPVAKNVIRPVVENVISPVVGVSALTWFVRYIWNLQFLYNNIII